MALWKWPRPPCPKKEIKSPINLKFSHPLAARCKKPFSPHKENIWNQNHLFCLRLVFTIFIYGVFKSHLKKSSQPKVPILTKNHNLTYVPPI